MDQPIECRSILVVEDEADLRELVGEMLARDDYHLTFVENGRQALDLIEQGHVFALILSDIRMPTMDGLEFLEELRASGSSTPFVLLSAHGDKDHILRGLQLGAFDFVQKPYRIEQLRTVVAAAVEVGAKLLQNVRLIDMIAVEGGPLEKISRKLVNNERSKYEARARRKKAG